MSFHPPPEVPVPTAAVRSHDRSQAPAEALPPAHAQPSWAPGVPLPAGPRRPTASLAGKLLIAVGLFAAAAIVVGRELLPKAAVVPPDAPIRQAAATLRVAVGRSAVVPPRALHSPSPPYGVRVGPYREPRQAMGAYARLQDLGSKPTFQYRQDGIYVRARLDRREQDDSEVARVLAREGFPATPLQSLPEREHAHAVEAADVRYRVFGVRIDFEGGRTKGWEIGGTAISMRNTSQFSFSGEHALQISLRNTSGSSPGLARLRPESVVLPLDRFSMRVLQPSPAGERLGARFYLVDARGRKFRHLAQPLEPDKWVELQWFIPASVTLPIAEIGLEFRPRRASWSGVVCIDRVEQQRPVQPRRREGVSSDVSRT